MAAPAVAAGIAAGGSLLSSYLNRGKADERQQLLNNLNDYEKFLAQMIAENPTLPVDNFVSARARANILGGKRGTGIDLNSKSPQSTGIISGEDRVAADPVLASILSTLRDPGKNNLALNQTTGLYDFIAPQLNQAVSTKLGNKNVFKQGGVTQRFGETNIGVRPGTNAGGAGVGTLVSPGQNNFSQFLKTREGQ